MFKSSASFSGGLLFLFRKNFELFPMFPCICSYELFMMSVGRKCIYILSSGLHVLRYTQTLNNYYIFWSHTLISNTIEHLRSYRNRVLKDMQIFSTSQKGRSKFNIEKEVQVIYSYVIHTFFFFFRVWFLQLIYFEYVDPWMLCDNETSFNLNILSILGIPFPILK